jgi:hypothetical protein
MVHLMTHSRDDYRKNRIKTSKMFFFNDITVTCIIIYVTVKNRICKSIIWRFP